MVFWVVMPCNMMVSYQLLRGLYCLHLSVEMNPEDGGIMVL